MRLPSAGKGSSNATPPIINLYDANSNIVGSNTVQAQSMLTQILPLIELGNVQDLFQDQNLAYNDTVNVVGARTAIDAFICPTTGGVRGSTETDNQGFGYTDYAPVILVDNTITAGNRFLTGAFNGRGGRRIGAVSDGTSNTIGIAESTGRHESYNTPLEGSPNFSEALSEQASHGENAVWRWADPANAFIASDRINTLASSRNFVADWGNRNAGPNGETFSFHTGGANVAYVDGSTHFVSDAVEVAVYAATCSSAGGEVQILPQ